MPIYEKHDTRSAPPAPSTGSGSLAACAACARNMTLGKERRRWRLLPMWGPGLTGPRLSQDCGDGEPAISAKGAAAGAPEARLGVRAGGATGSDARCGGCSGRGAVAAAGVVAKRGLGAAPPRPSTATVGGELEESSGSKLVTEDRAGARGEIVTEDRAGARGATFCGGIARRLLRSGHPGRCWVMYGKALSWSEEASVRASTACCAVDNTFGSLRRRRLILLSNTAVGSCNRRSSLPCNRPLSPSESVEEATE